MRRRPRLRRRDIVRRDFMEDQGGTGTDGAKRIDPQDLLPHTECVGERGGN